MTVRIITGDCRAVMASLPSDSVHCIVSSPPYWGLRDYQVEPSIWGGALDCEHNWADSSVTRKGSTNGRATSTLQSAGSEKTVGVGSANDVGETKQYRRDASNICNKCGAWRGSFGFEPTPEMFVEHMVAIFREAHRVLRPDGTLWLNLGDSYAGSWGAQGTPETRTGISRRQTENGQRITSGAGTIRSPGLKPKDLVGIPWRVAFALQADGWWLRQEIVWSKPNPMPESVTDRCTKAHEHIFLLAKSDRYYFDAEAISEPVTGSTLERLAQPNLEGQEGSWRVPGKTNGPMKAKVPKRSGNIERKPPSARGVPEDGNGALGGSIPWEGMTRNKRSVWTVPTMPFKEAHFATFPPALVEPCILAGCLEGGTVLDPFGGAGTTGLVADRLKRNAILIELNPDFADMARRRINKDAGLFAEVTG